MICTCDQCDSAFCALQLTALIKTQCCACLHPNTILIETGWTTVPCPATNLSILICKSPARTKQSVINVALKTHLEIRLGIFIYVTSLLHRPDDYLVSHQAVPPHFTTKLRPLFQGRDMQFHMFIFPSHQFISARPSVLFRFLSPHPSTHNRLPRGKNSCLQAGLILFLVLLKLKQNVPIRTCVVL